MTTPTKKNGVRPAKQPFHTGFTKIRVINLFAITKRDTLAINPEVQNIQQY
jgi:hypothetical protein